MRSDFNVAFCGPAHLILQNTIVLSFAIWPTKHSGHAQTEARHTQAKVLGLSTVFLFFFFPFLSFFFSFLLRCRKSKLVFFHDPKLPFSWVFFGITPKICLSHSQDGQKSNGMDTGNFKRWGWVFLYQRGFSVESSLQRISSIFLLWKRNDSSVVFVHVILTRQTCGQRSNRVAESKRRALGNYFFERICYMFPISKCRGDWDLGLCTTSALAFGEPQRNGKIRFFLRRNTFFSEVATALRFSKRKSRSCAQT